MLDDIFELEEEIIIILIFVLFFDIQRLKVGFIQIIIVILENDNLGGVFQFFLVMKVLYFVKVKGIKNI